MKPMRPNPCWLAALARRPAPVWPRRLAALLPLVPALAGAALAAEGTEGHGTPWLDLVWKAINLAVLVAILYWAGRKAVGQGLGAMARSVGAVWAGGRKLAEDAQSDLAAQREKMEQLKRGLAGMVSEARADAERERQRLVAEAQERSDKLRLQTEQQIVQAVARARMELRQALAAETVRLAEQLLAQRINSEQRRRLVAQYIDQLGSGA
jgi:F-type H+-transporting ATPase subunit b